jgi:bzd-type benzoyl-CoA reductase N subunit
VAGSDTGTAIDVFRDILNDPRKVATEWKARGKKVVGYRCIYVPEEIIWAADMLPYQVYGTTEAVSLADSYFQPCVCEFVRNVFDIALDRRLDFLDKLVLPNTCDAVRKLYDMWNAYVDSSSCYLINNPQKLCCDQNHDYYRVELERFKTEMEELSGRRISDESLQEAINLQNEIRGLLKELYLLRREDDPPISGSEALEVATATTLMPRDRVAPLLRQLLEELKGREVPEAFGPRILITGSVMDHPALIHLVEEEEGVVVADDLCNTVRNFWSQVEDDEDPLEALYRFNNERPLCACMNPPEPRLDYLMELIDEFNVDGVIYFTLKYCHPFLYEAPIFREKLQAKGIPTMLLETGHDLSGLGQLRTRIQAFIEMLEFAD